MVRLIVKRKNVEGLFKIKKWKLVYGRRKTGKTFFVKNFVSWDKYYFVHRSREITEIKNNYKIRFDELKREIKEREDLRIVIDEFHRLGDEFVDFLHSLAGQGADLILITSSLHFANDLLRPNSPLLGLIFPIEFNIFSPTEVLSVLGEHLSGRDVIRRAIFSREPFFLDLVLQDDFEDLLLRSLKVFVPSLIGEIFKEDDRKLTEIYEGILYAIGTGNLTSLEISTYLHSQGLIKRNDPSLISMHLRNLEDMRILRKVEVIGKRKKYHYIINSPVVDLFYYLDGRYGIDFISYSERVLENRIPFYIENFFRDLLSELFGMKSIKISKPDLEIDITLVKFQKMRVVAEVKWVKDLDKDELRKVEEKLSKFEDCKRILIVPEKEILPYEPKSIEIWDVRRILQEVKKRR